MPASTDYRSCRCGSTSWPGRSRPAPALAGDTTSTSRSSAPASPGCGRRTTCSGPTRRCGSRCSRPRSPASARRGATAAGARRCTRSARDAGRRGRPRRRDRAVRARCSDTVAEVVRVAARRGHRRRRRRGGTVVLARSDAAAGARARRGRRGRASSASELDLLDAAAARARLNATGGAGRARTRRTARRSSRPSWCAAWPRSSKRRGARDLRADPRHRDRARRRAHDAAGRVRADVVVRATEGYTAQLPGHAPRARAGLLADHRHRAAAGRVVGRDRPARARDLHRPPPPDHLRPAHRRRTAWSSAAAARRTTSGRGSVPSTTGCRACSPRSSARWSSCSRCCDGAAITHRWGGPLGIARDWHASVGLDRTTGLAWAGGYVGDGVSTTNLAGRTLADLVTGRDTELTALPWVGHRSRDWEPEPLRWLGANAGLQAMTWADHAEARRGAPVAAGRPGQRDDGAVRLQPVPRSPGCARRPAPTAPRSTHCSTRPSWVTSRWSTTTGCRSSSPPASCATVTVCSSTGRPARGGCARLAAGAPLPGGHSVRRDGRGALGVRVVLPLPQCGAVRQVHRVTDDRQGRALDVITEQLIPGRTAEICAARKAESPRRWCSRCRSPSGH